MNNSSQNRYNRRDKKNRRQYGMRVTGRSTLTVLAPAAAKRAAALAAATIDPRKVKAKRRRNRKRTGSR